MLVATSACTVGDDGLANVNTPRPELLAQETSEYQRGILSDAVVTAGEYESALFAFRDCATDVGATPGPIEELANNQRGFSFEIASSDPARVQEIEAAVFECEGEYFALIGQVWAEQNILDDSQREVLKPQVVSCLQLAGVRVEESDSFEELVVAVNEALLTEDSALAVEVNECLREYAAYFQTTQGDDDGEHEEH